MLKLGFKEDVEKVKIFEVSPLFNIDYENYQESV